MKRNACGSANRSLQIEQIHTQVRLTHTQGVIENLSSSLCLKTTKLSDDKVWCLILSVSSAELDRQLVNPVSTRDGDQRCRNADSGARLRKFNNAQLIWHKLKFAGLLIKLIAAHLTCSQIFAKDTQCGRGAQQTNQRPFTVKLSTNLFAQTQKSANAQINCYQICNWLAQLQLQLQLPLQKLLLLLLHLLLLNNAFSLNAVH